MSILDLFWFVIVPVVVCIIGRRMVFRARILALISGTSHDIERARIANKMCRVVYLVTAFWLAFFVLTTIG